MSTEHPVPDTEPQRGEPQAAARVRFFRQLGEQPSARNQAIADLLELLYDGVFSELNRICVAENTDADWAAMDQMLQRYGDDAVAVGAMIDFVTKADTWMGLRSALRLESRIPTMKVLALLHYTFMAAAHGQLLVEENDGIYRLVSPLTHAKPLKLGPTNPAKPRRGRRVREGFRREVREEERRRRGDDPPPSRIFSGPHDHGRFV